MVGTSAGPFALGVRRVGKPEAARAVSLMAETENLYAHPANSLNIDFNLSKSVMFNSLVSYAR